MIVASVRSAHSNSACRRSGASTTPVGHWCAGVSTTARAPLAASRSTSMPSASTGTGTASMPGAAEASMAVSE